MSPAPDATPEPDVVPEPDEGPAPPECVTDEDCGAGSGCNVDKCLAGACVVAQVPDGDPCDDGLDCTNDTCLAGICQGTPTDGNCLIDGACYADGQSQEGNLCATCQSGVVVDAWTLLADGTGCEDGYDCTVDTCVEGDCEHLLMETACVLDSTCYYEGDTKPGDPCMSCQPELAQIVFSPVDCDDGDPCTVDSCGTDAGGCVNAPDESLDPSCVSWAPPGLTQVGPCLPGQTDCVFTVDDDSEVLDSLQRIYQGSALYFRTTWLDSDGSVLPHQFPSSQGVTPVEETCCSTGGQGGPDSDGDDLCDTDVDVWSTWTWSDLGFTPHGAACEAEWLGECDEASDQHAYVYDFTSQGTQDAATFTATAGRYVACELCQLAQISVTATLDPSWASDETAGGQEVCTSGCLLVAPEALQISVNMDCTGNQASGAITLTDDQRAGFLPGDGVESVNPLWEEVTTNLDAIVQGALGAFEASDAAACAFPSNQGVTPIEGSCCSAKGLGGPDTNNDQLCDPDPGVWTVGQWGNLDFQLEGAHGFVYSFDAQGTGPGASFVATANADLDCDGTQSTFQRMGFVPEAGLGLDSCVPEEGSESWTESVLPYFYAHGLKE